MTDPYAMQNLAIHPEYQVIKEQLKERLFQQLKEEEDPRMFGKGYIFDEYKYSGAVNDFYNRFMQGDSIATGWVNESDFEKDFPKMN